MPVQWWLAFRRRPGLLSKTLCVLLIPSAHADVHVWSAEKLPGLNLTCLTACYDHVMFASQQPSDCDFLRGVCLHHREMGMIYMHHWKQEAWVWISAMWLQVQMSVSQSMYVSSQYLTSGGLINSDCINAPFLFCRTYLVHKEFELSHQIFAVGGRGWLAISHLDQEYMYVCGQFSHCTQGLRKFMVTTYQYRATRIKLRSVRLLCRMHLGETDYLLLAVRKCSCQTLATLQYRSTSVVVIVHL